MNGFDWLNGGIVAAFLVGFAVGVLFAFIATLVEMDRRGREEAEEMRRSRGE